MLYKANLSQDEQSDPTGSVHTKTYPANFRLFRDTTGTYFLEADEDSFTPKTLVTISNTSDANIIKAQFASPRRIGITTREGNTFELIDGVLDCTTLILED